MSGVFEEIVDFMAGRTPTVMAEFQPSEESLARVRELLVRLKDGNLTPIESAELDSYVKLESIMARAKARAL